MVGKQYAVEVLGLAQQAVDNQYEAITKVADVIYESLKDGGLLHVFGCGHSHMLMEECFYRAGGLVPINPIFETATMLHEGAIKSSLIERMSGYASLILDNYAVKRGEVILIFSTSGINSLPIEMALAAKEKGLTTVAFTSLNYREAQSRYVSGEKLYEVVDYVVDNQAPQGDAILNFEQSQTRAIPASTVLSVTLLNVLMAEIVARFDENGLVPPVFVSGNVAGGMERNQNYLDAFKERVKAL